MGGLVGWWWRGADAAEGGGAHHVLPHAAVQHGIGHGPLLALHWRGADELAVRRDRVSEEARAAWRDRASESSEHGARRFSRDSESGVLRVS